MNTYHTLLTSGLAMLFLVAPTGYILASLTLEDNHAKAWFGVFAVAFLSGLVLLLAAGNVFHS